MKSLLFLLSAILILLSCSQKPQATLNDEADRDTVANNHAVNTSNQPSSTKLQELFTIVDAEKILGEPAHITDSTLWTQQTITAYRAAYTADAAAAKQGAIFFLVEEYTKIPDAQTKYAFIKASNENHSGFKALENVGDEAYFHSDNENFYFIMARKGTRVVTFKVNKITPRTSLEDFNRVAREVIAKL